MTDTPGPGMYGSDGKFIRYVSEEELTAMLEASRTSEPGRYAWVRSGLLVAGTLADWVDTWEGDYYAGEDDLTRWLLEWDGDPRSAPVIHEVKVESDGVEGEWLHFTITCDKETVLTRVSANR